MSGQSQLLTDSAIETVDHVASPDAYPEELQSGFKFPFGFELLGSIYELGNVRFRLS